MPEVFGTKRVCPQCDGEYIARAENQVYCSPICRNNYHYAPAPPRYKPCRRCQETFHAKGPNSQFCDTCAEERKPKPRLGNVIACVRCDQPFIRKTGSQRYCSKKCLDETAKERWTTGGPRPCRVCGETIEKPYANQQYCVGCRPQRRHPHKYRHHKGKECARCGFSPEHLAQLDVHHIDGNHSNNDPSNLQTLCANCHRLDRVGLLAA